MKSLNREIREKGIGFGVVRIFRGLNSPPQFSICAYLRNPWSNSVGRGFAFFLSGIARSDDG